MVCVDVQSGDPVMMFMGILKEISSDGEMGLLKRAFLDSVRIVQPSNLIRNRLKIDKNGSIRIQDVYDEEFTASLANIPLYLVGFGKAAGEMGDEFLRRIHKHNIDNYSTKIEIQKGIFSIPFGCRMNEISDSFTDKVYFYNGAKNNLPDADSVKTTEMILEMIDSIPKCSEKPLVICFISGGGSALLTLPIDGITLEEKLGVIRTMVKNGAQITQLNPVRSALSQVKQGKLAARIQARDANILTLILSDIVNDPLTQIASGPTCLPEYSFDNLQNILQDLNVTDKISQSIQTRMRQNFDDFKEFKNNKNIFLKNFIIGNNKLSHREALKGFEKNCEIIDFGTNVHGEVREFVERLTKKIQNIPDSDKNYLLIGSGETTIKFDKNNIGLGGRCQHMGLLFMLEYFTKFKSFLCKDLKIDVLFSGTDGADGPTPVAGVNYSLSNGRFLSPKNMDFDIKTAKEYCDNFDSYRFFKEYSPLSLIETGPTGTNVMDLYMVLVSKDPKSEI